MANKSLIITVVVLSDLVDSPVGTLEVGLFDMLDSINKLRPCLSTFQPKWQNSKTFNQINEILTDIEIED